MQGKMNQKRNPAQENTYIKTNAEQITSAALSFQLKKKKEPTKETNTDSLQKMPSNNKYTKKS
jgi:hypothetical protein